MYVNRVYRPTQPAEPLMSHDITGRSWANSGTNLYYLDGQFDDITC